MKQILKKVTQKFWLIMSKIIAKGWRLIILDILESVIHVTLCLLISLILYKVTYWLLFNPFGPSSLLAVPIAYRISSPVMDVNLRLSSPIVDVNLRISAPAPQALTKNTMQIVAFKEHSKIPGAITIILENNQLYEGKEALEALFTSLKASDTFNSFAKYKIIMVVAEIELNREHSIHCNTLIGPDTSFENYYSTVESDINHYYELVYSPASRRGIIS